MYLYIPGLYTKKSTIHHYDYEKNTSRLYIGTFIDYGRLVNAPTP
jgi:hypothetical protein